MAQKINQKKSIKMESVLPSHEDMLKAGVHFGHRKSRWNPAMSPYVFGVRDNIHLIDLEKSRQKLEEALSFLKELKDKEATILFVGTKVSAKEITRKTAEECEMPYVVERWIGGTLTNFKIISERLKYFRDLEEKQSKGELEKYSRKEQSDFRFELEKLNRQFGGVKKMEKTPDALFLSGVANDDLAVKEAKAVGLPLVGICDTNSNPDNIDYPIPANDDAISSLRLILGILPEILK